jgi:hypothetical protein
LRRLSNPAILCMWVVKPRGEAVRVVRGVVVVSILLLIVACNEGKVSSPIEEAPPQEAAEQKPSAPDSAKEINAMSDEETMRFTNCQFSKMMEDRGRKATMAWADEWGRQAAEEIRRGESGNTLQEDLLAEGYTCTPEEVQEVLAAQSASASAAVRAIAEDEAQTEEEWAASASARADEVQLSAGGECRIEEYAREENFEPDLLKVNVSDYMKAEDTSEEEALTFFDVPHYTTCS